MVSQKGKLNQYRTACCVLQCNTASQSVQPVFFTLGIDIKLQRLVPTANRSLATCDKKTNIMT